MRNFEEQDELLLIQRGSSCCRRDKDQNNSRRQVVINSSTGGVGPLPIITQLLAEPLTVVSVTIDTNGLKNPAAWLNFSSIISLPLGISVTLNFQIRRTVNGEDSTKVGSTYTFSTLANILESEAFGFQFFDHDVPEGIVTYTIEVSTNSVIDITQGLTIVNATATALAVGNG